MTYIPLEIADKIISFLIPPNWNDRKYGGTTNDNGDEDYGVCDMLALRLVDGRFNDIVCRHLLLKANAGEFRLDIVGMSISLVASFFVAKHDAGALDCIPAIRRAKQAVNFLDDHDHDRHKPDRSWFYMKAACGAMIAQRGIYWAYKELFKQIPPELEATRLYEMSLVTNSGSLSVAAYLGDKRLVEELLAKGQDPNEDDITYGYPMYAAYCGGHPNIMHRLIEAGAHANLSASLGYFGCPAEVAAREGHMEVILFLADRKAGFGFALSNAILFGHTDIANWMVQRLEFSVNVKSCSFSAPLQLAIAKGFHKTTLLICRRQDLWPNVRDDFGYIPLHQIVFTNWIDVAETLLKNKYCNPNITDGRGNTPLHTACRFGRKRMARVLLLKKKVQANRFDLYNHTPLGVAIRYCHFSTAKEVLRFSRVDAHLGGYNARPLELSVLVNSEDILQELLKRPEVRADRWGALEAFSTAVRKDKVNFMKKIIETCEVDLNRTDDTGLAPLHHAVAEASLYAVDFLLSQPILNPDRLNEFDESALMIAARNDKASIVQTLLNCKRVNANVSSTQGTALITAVLGSAYAALRILLAHPNVDPNMEISTRPCLGGLLFSGITPLVLAAKLGLIEAVEILLEHEAVNVNKADGLYGRTPLGWAAMARMEAAVRVVSALLGHPSIEPNREDWDRCTPLLLAVQRGHFQTMKCLLDCPLVDPNGENIYKWAPLQLAIQINLPEFAEELMKNPRIDMHRINIDPDKRHAIPLTAVEQAYRLRRHTITELIHRHHPSLDVNPHVVRRNYFLRNKRELFQVPSI